MLGKCLRTLYSSTIAKKEPILQLLNLQQCTTAALLLARVFLQKGKMTYFQKRAALLVALYVHFCDAGVGTRKLAILGLAADKLASDLSSLLLSEDNGVKHLLVQE
jgi:hypothetical protein